MRRKQTLLIIVSLGLGALVFLAPKFPKKSVEEISESNVETKINQAIELVNSGKQPMQGIMKLREVLSEDSNNIRAHFQLGIFSITSGQYQKAVERFEKVKSLDASNNDANYYLGHALANLGKKHEAITAFSTFKKNSTDSEKKSEAQQFINELKR